MKVLLLSGASSVHTIRWANAFAAQGLEVHLVSQHAPIDPLAPAVRLHRPPHFGGAGYVLNGPRLRRLVRDLGIDVVNAHYATGYGLLARAVRSVPVVLNVWGSDVYDFPSGGPLHRALVRANLRAATRVVSTSRVMAERTRQLCPGLGPITVVPFGVDLSLFRPLERDGHHAPVIGTVKSLAPKYGIDTLIGAFALLAPEFPTLRLRIVGSGPQQQELERMAERLGVAARTDIVPRVAHDQVPDQLRRLDVYVALSKLDSESFGVAVIEASACGLPVVVSDAGGLPEVVVDGRTGFVVPRADAAAAAAKVRELLRSPDLRRRTGRAGAEHVAAEYAWDACVQRQVAVLREAVAARKVR